jgi:hypothetical protein
MTRRPSATKPVAMSHGADLVNTNDPRPMMTKSRLRDPRLLGTWKSDARRTAVEIAARRDISGTKKKALQRMFGKLEVRYTKTRCYMTFDDVVDVSSYEVVAKDEWSVAVVYTGSIGSAIYHIHFEGHRYWICLGAIREYFRRID